MLRSEKNTETEDLIIGRHQATTEVFQKIMDFKEKLIKKIYN